MKKLISILLLLGTLLIPTTTFAQHTGSEHIMSYSSDIIVHEDRTLTVKEEITVYANGETIKHGIYRDFPTEYRDSVGATHHITFTLQDVQMNGAHEPYHTVHELNGIRVYIGDPDVILAPGTYTYDIVYTVNRELGFFKDHDELYWNVTGNGWDYSIDNASATVHLPSSIPLSAVKVLGYTGSYGSVAQHFTASTTPNGIMWATTEPLNAREGLSIVAEWPKGYINPPNFLENVSAFFIDNWVVGVEGLLIIVTFVAYFVKWWKDGRDPKKGVVIAQYEPPQGLSPAALRYIAEESYDNKALVASLINLAINKCIRIEEVKKFLSKSYKLIKIGDTVPHTDEQPVLSALFVTGNDEFLPSRDNYVPLLNARENQKTKLKSMFEPLYIVTNLNYAVVLTLLSLGISMALFIWAVKTDGPVLVTVAAFLIVFIVNTVFIFLLRRRTAEGRLLADQIEGFKLFLSVTEKDRMNFANPPEQTPELFERYLPYALALGVENKWAEQFATTFKNLEQNGHAYVPLWYIGSNFSSSDIGGFTSSLGNSFASTIASSSTPPGSSSGGGGFSGGGGGGGGGGGW